MEFWGEEEEGGGGGRWGGGGHFWGAGGGLYRDLGELMPTRVGGDTLVEEGMGGEGLDMAARFMFDWEDWRLPDWAGLSASQCAV